MLQKHVSTVDFNKEDNLLVQDTKDRKRDKKYNSHILIYKNTVSNTSNALQTTSIKQLCWTCTLFQVQKIITISKICQVVTSIWAQEDNVLIFHQK